MKPEDNETSNESEKLAMLTAFSLAFSQEVFVFLALIYRSFLRGQDDFLFMDLFTHLEIEFVKDFGRRRRLFGGCFFSNYSWTRRLHGI